MGTADEQRGVSEEGGSAGKKPLWWDDGTDGESGEGGDGWRGKTLLLYCVAAPGNCPVPLQHSTSSPFVLNRSIIIILIIIMTTTMLKKYI